MHCPYDIQSYQSLTDSLMAISPSLLLAVNPASASGADCIRVHGAQGINLWRLANRGRTTEGIRLTRSALVVQDNSATAFVAHTEGPNDSDSEFADQWFTQPIDHFSNSTDTSNQRYWIHTRHYTPGSGGPVIVLYGPARQVAKIVFPSWTPGSLRF